jgi:hypothetical protein
MCDPELDMFMRFVSGFDLQAKTKSEEQDLGDFAFPPTPKHWVAICDSPVATLLESCGSVEHFWNTSRNPPYAYYLYYLHANLATLNQLRKSKGMSMCWR